MHSKDYNALKKQIALSSIIEQRVRLKKDGREFKGLCPFHPDRNPSLTVNDQKALYNCFSCGAHGDHFDFLSEQFGLSHGDAVRYLGGELTSADLKPVGELPAPAQADEVAAMVEPLGIQPDGATVMEADGKTMRLWNPKRHGTDKEWTTLRPTAVYPYLTDAGLHGFVLRCEFPDGGKFTPTVTRVRNLTTGAECWALHSFPEPRPLYNAHLLAGNTLPVLVVEGEKCASVPVDGMVVVTWPQGTSNAPRADWQQLAGRDVVIWPDNDKPGHDAVYGNERHSQGLIHILREVAASLRVVVPPKGKAKGWDIADATPEERATLLATAGAVNYDDFKPQASPTPAPTTARRPDPTDWPFRVLGHGNWTYYFLEKRTRNILPMTSGKLGKKSDLLNLAPLQFWERTFGGDDGFTAARVTVAANTLIQACCDAGSFRPDNIYGRGAWMEGDTPVVHLGDRLLVDGAEVDMYDYQSPNGRIYEQCERIDVPIDTPMGAVEAHKLLELCEMLNWENPLDARLLAGWIALAPACGALDWRPHIWLTGPSGAGKSWVMENIIHRCLEGMSLQIGSSATEPAIRRTLRYDALPVIFDESEGETEAARANIDNVMQLMRQASSNGGGEIIKAGGDGGVDAFRIKTMFAFSSIGSGIKEVADKSRITKFRLRKANDSESLNKFKKEISPRARALLTPNYVRRLQGRSLANANTIRVNAEIFSDAVAMHLNNKRVGDQIGALLTGAYLLHSDKIISAEQAREWIETQNWQTEPEPESDFDVLMRHILTSFVYTEDNKRQVVLTLINKIISEDKVEKECRQILDDYGVKILKKQSIFRK